MGLFFDRLHGNMHHFLCSICGTGFKSEGAYKYHREMHKNKVSVLCRSHKTQKRLLSTERTLFCDDACQQICCYSETHV